ncbi:CRAL-TRIO domain-containing protein [Polychytrium aggregatum]|uniref:CRAL-TRIO domain-containing protein n=1 Tax=Polychytrium aggregatum TaxID=110093 RepID=UPI0022FEA321|nr:CRAL-TRIO domain-containing protein [Polychytrium aggregatum]KAI9202242.1 CRAL-TRIO domain-containing protein [Polychytrium aggregatum]
MGFIDMKKLFEITTPERMIKVYVREYEKFLNYRLAACSAKKGVKLEQSCTILDLKGVPLTQFGAVKKLVSQVSEIAQNYYPETLGKMFIINAPTLFTTVWAVVKLMLDENTVNKISILGSSYQKQLLECIDADCLPASYGGTCRCPNGCETGDVGPWNDGSVPGFPKPEFEDYTLRDMASRDTQASS